MSRTFTESAVQEANDSVPLLRAVRGVGDGVSEQGSAATKPEAWYHADFCHAFAWVYEDGDKLRVRWAERTGSGLYLHSKSDCDRCREILKDEHAARDGEFTMEKPPEEFSSAASFFHVLAEIGKYVPGLIEDET